MFLLQKAVQKSVVGMSFLDELKSRMDGKLSTTVDQEASDIALLSAFA